MSPADGNDEFGDGRNDGEVFDTRWNSDSETATVAVVRSIAACSGEDPLEMEPLYHTVNTDAIDALFARNGSEIVVTVTVDEYSVRIETDRIRVREKFCRE